MPRHNIMNHPGQNSGITRPRRPGRLPRRDTPLVQVMGSAEHQAAVPRSIANNRDDIRIRLSAWTTPDFFGAMNFAFNKSPAAASQWANAAAGWDQFRVNRMRASVCFDTAVNSGIIASSVVGGFALVEYPNVVGFAYDNDDPQATAPLPLFATGSTANVFAKQTAKLMDAEGTCTYSVVPPKTNQMIAGGIVVPGEEFVDITAVGALCGKLYFSIDQPVASLVGHVLTYPLSCMMEWDVTFHQRRL